MKRWYITGGAGSGKTRLAALIAERCSVPRYDVDRGEAPTSLEREWVVEGAHLWGMDKYIKTADVVIWLDLPPHVAMRRIITRHVRLTIKGQNRHPGVKNLARFVAGQPQYYSGTAREPLGPTDWDALSRAATQALLTRHRDDVVHLRRPTQVRAWLRRLQCATEQ